MVKAIKEGEEIYAILVCGEPEKETQWFGEPFESLQASRMNYPSSKTFRTHYHILNPRIVKRTQEAFVVIKGLLQIDIWNQKKNLLGTLTAGPGEAIFVYRGGHSVKVLEDFVGYEIKAGQYSYVSEDKSFD